MKIQYLVLPSLAVGVAAALLLPARTEAWSTIGGSLATNQRDFRIFNNFSDVGANDNQVADANFPGHQGAVMAIWKGSVEWGAVLHGNGNGDPHQPAGLGSGGANFDAVFAGEANGTGNTNNNIHSELAGGSGGVLAFTETPISDGWRILYYSSWSWSDGPNTNIGSANIDLQGVACHEYGHALGLGHSNVSGATMFPSISGTGVAQRSLLTTDDSLGVQAVYGVAAANKPRITGVSVNAGVLTITGVNFGASNNEVWFAPDTVTSTGVDPVVKALGVNSTGGGTQIVVTAPAAAGPGDVFVKLSSAGNSTLSNGWPVDPGSVPPCPAWSTFCTPNANSFCPSGATAAIGGSQSITANDLHLQALCAPPNKTGLWFFGQNQVAPVAFGNGVRCIGSPFFRLPATSTNLFGDNDFAVDNTALPSGQVFVAGQTYAFQFWYRDPDAGGANYNASEGLIVPMCP